MARGGRAARLLRLDPGCGRSSRAVQGLPRPQLPPVLAGRGARRAAALTPRSALSCQDLVCSDLSPEPPRSAGGISGLRLSLLRPRGHSAACPVGLDLEARVQLPCSFVTCTPLSPCGCLPFSRAPLPVPRASERQCLCVCVCARACGETGPGWCSRSMGGWKLLPRAGP